MPPKSSPSTASIRRFLLMICLTGMLLFPFRLWSAEPEALPPEIRLIMESPRYQYARWGLFVLDMAAEKAIYTVHADTMFGPASLTKLFTVAAALDGLGPDFFFTTPVYRQGTIDKSGNLKGDLIIAASGDLNFSDLRAVAARIKAAGIKAVKGDMIIDDRLFKSYRAYSVARPGRLLYALPPVLVHDNLIKFTVSPGPKGAAAKVTWRPSAACLRITSHVRTVDALEGEKIDISEDTDGRMTISGQIPANAPIITKTAPLPDPPSVLRSLLIEACTQAGVRLLASAKLPNPSARLPKPDRYGEKLIKVTEWASPPLKNHLHTILKTSYNQGADMLPLLLAVKNGGRTFEDGMKIERAFLSRTGIDLGALSLGDGSGISPANLTTPRTVVQLLKFMAGHPYYDVFREGLPILGQDGTLSQKAGDGSPAKGKIVAKTGTIGLFDLLNDSGFVQIKALAGYMTTQTGRPFAFALIVNHVHPTDAPDRKSVMNLTNDVGTDLARIAELIYLKN